MTEKNEAQQSPRDLFTQEGELRIFNPPAGRLTSKAFKADWIQMISAMKNGVLPAGNTILNGDVAEEVKKKLRSRKKKNTTEYHINLGQEAIPFALELEKGVRFAREVLSQSPQLLAAVKEIVEGGYGCEQKLKYQGGIRVTKEENAGNIIIMTEPLPDKAGRPLEVQLPAISYYAFMSGFRETVQKVHESLSSKLITHNPLLEHLGITDVHAQPSQQQLDGLEAFGKVTDKLGFLRGFIEFALENGMGNGGAGFNMAMDVMRTLTERSIAPNGKVSLDYRNYYPAIYLSYWNTMMRHQNYFSKRSLEITDNRVIRAFTSDYSATAPEDPIALIQQYGAYLFDNKPLQPYFGNKEYRDAELARREKFLQARTKEFWDSYPFWWIFNQQDGELSAFFDEIKSTYRDQLDRLPTAVVPGYYVNYLENGEREYSYLPEIPEDPTERVDFVQKITEERMGSELASIRDGQLHKEWEDLLILDSADRSLIIAKSILSPVELAAFLQREADTILARREREEEKISRINVARDVALHTLGWNDLYEEDGTLKDQSTFAKALPFWIAESQKKHLVEQTIIWEKISRFAQQFHLFPPEEEQLAQIGIELMKE